MIIRTKQEVQIKKQHKWSTELQSEAAETRLKKNTINTCLKDLHRVPTGQEVNKVFSKGSTSVCVSNVSLNTLLATLASFTHLSHSEKSEEKQLTYFTYLLQ